MGISASKHKPYLSDKAYGYESLNLNNCQIHQLNVCWNNIYRRIFHYNQRESVKELQFYCGRLDFKHVYAKCKLTFMHSLTLSFNSVIRICYLMFKMSDEYNNLCCGINLNCIINDCSVSHIKKCVLVRLAIHA